MAEVDTLLVLDKNAVEREVATTSKLLKSVGLPDDSAETDPAAVSATVTALLRGMLTKLEELKGFTDGLESALANATVSSVLPFRSLDLDETEEQVKATAGDVYFIYAINLSNAKRFLKFYNATAANTTVGTTTPVMTFPIPTLGDTNGMGFCLPIPSGISFDTAISVAATTGLADNDTGAPGANEIVVVIGYV